MSNPGNRSGGGDGVFPQTVKGAANQARASLRNKRRALIVRRHLHAMRPHWAGVELSSGESEALDMVEPTGP